MSLSRFFRPVGKKRSRSHPNVIDFVDTAEDDDEQKSRAKREPSGSLSHENGTNHALSSNRDFAEITKLATGEQSRLAAQEVIVLENEDSSASPQADIIETADFSAEKTDESTSVSSQKAMEPRKAHAELCENVQSNAVAEPLSEKSTATRMNPFAKFVCQGMEGNHQISLTSLRDGARPSGAIRPPSKKVKTSKTGCTEQKKEWIRVKDLPLAEQERITAKWHSFVIDGSSIEESRFQILVAARLHARCQEGPVRQAMAALRQQLLSLSVPTMAQVDPQTLHSVLSNLQYFRTKASHLVKAAQEIESQFAGQVPEQDSQLRQLTGIGPVFADLLAFVNTRAVHAKRRCILDSNSGN